MVLDGPLGIASGTANGRLAEGGVAPPQSKAEGIRLAFEGGGGEFDEEVSGRTMFVLTRPGANPAPQPAITEGETYPAPAEVQK